MADNDKKLRNNGYMKAPNSYWLWTKSSVKELKFLWKLQRKRISTLRFYSPEVQAVAVSRFMMELFQEKELMVRVFLQYYLEIMDFA